MKIEYIIISITVIYTKYNLHKYTKSKLLMLSANKSKLFFKSSMIFKTRFISGKIKSSRKKYENAHF